MNISDFYPSPTHARLLILAALQARARRLISLRGENSIDSTMGINTTSCLFLLYARRDIRAVIILLLLL